MKEEQLKIVLALLAIIMLTGCTSGSPMASPTPVVSPQLIPSGTPLSSLVPPTLAIDTSIKTATLTPTVTANHTSTSTTTSTIAPTFTSIITHTPSNTPFLTRTPRGEPGLIVTLGERTGGYNIVPLFSPDGQYIILAGRRIQQWDIYTYQLIHEFFNPNPDICTVENASLSTDGSLLAVSFTQCVYTSRLPGRLLVWDTQTGILLQDWTQEYAELIDPRQGPYYIPVSTFAFLPDSTRLAYASGRTVEIRDVRQGGEPVIFTLGSLIYASEISIREDSEFLYVLMQWNKLKDFPSNYKTKFGVQIWGLNTHDLRLEIEYPEVDFPDEEMELHGVNLLHYYFVNGTAELTNLSTNETSSFLYRHGRQYHSQDLHYMVCIRYFGIDDQEQAIEVWNSDTWRNLYSFKPMFDRYWYYSSVAFSPDNTILAIANRGRVTLWDIRTVIMP
jgi:WD40 repeat protein